MKREPLIPGVALTPAGAHRFTLFAPHAKRVEVDVHEVGARAKDAVPRARHTLQRVAGEKGWWTAAAGLPEAFEYVFRLDGGPELLDPWARLVAGGELWADRSWEELGLPFRPCRSLWSPGAMPPPLASRPARPRIGGRDRVIYELHVRGFTRHASSGVTRPGSYLGLLEKIPYLVALGVTTVELLPVFAFDETENPRRNPRTGSTLLNYWGYSPISFFAPHPGYAASPQPGAALGEIVELVDALHRAGLEIVLDVVYNHTAEGGGGAGDPLRSFRALAEDVYYLRDPASGRPFDCTGCGNTVNTNHPAVRRMILESLRWWAGEVGVDGFRFDLAAVFFRGLHAEKLERSPIAEEIAADPLLADRLLIAEPWDVTGFTPPHGFPPPWKEWNGPFRDTVRRYVRGEALSARALAPRLAGVAERTGSNAPERNPDALVDFVACHDGFPVADLVAYATKHNEENGEGNRDGTNLDHSSNHGVEGPTEDAAIRALRDRQVRNFLALLFLTRATPMLLAGDERGRTQRGNNNAWCQDNEVSWLDWTRVDDDRDELVRRLIALRRELAGATFDRLAEAAPFDALAPKPPKPDAPKTARPSHGHAALLLFRDESDEAPDLALVLNPTDAPARLPLPRSRARRPWRLAIDTARPGAAAVPLPTDRPELAPDTADLDLPPRSLRLLIASHPES